MTIGGIGGGNAGGSLYQAPSASSTPRSGPAADASSPSSSSSGASASDSTSGSGNSIEQITYRNPCGDTVTFSGIVVVSPTGAETVGQPESSDCDPTSQKLAKAYSAY